MRQASHSGPETTHTDAALQNGGKAPVLNAAWREELGSTKGTRGGEKHNVQLHVKGKKARYVLQNNCYISISFHFITFFPSLCSSKMLGMTAWKQKLLWIAIRRIIQATMQSLELLIDSLNC
jgi:hypothetical protein